MHGQTFAGATPDTAVQSTPRSTWTPTSEFRHLLAPTSLSADEGTALLTGARLAALHGARLTLLHILPPVDPGNSVHWLDAISNLHNALSPAHQHSGNFLLSIENGRTKVLDFFKHHVPQEFRNAVRVNVECRVGVVADEIARFAADQAADLLVLCSRRQPWRLSLRPSIAQRVLRLTRKPVILIHPQHTV